ncbi:MAG: hypothetical protein SFZ24_01160 [Planctomycetota bacterium]|nr:hypothetical protein [Planctomycetota bacterium]
MTLTPPIARWMPAAGRRRIDFALRLCIVALLAVSVGGGMTGLILFYLVIRVMFDLGDPPGFLSSLANVLMALGWAAYALCGFAAALCLIACPVLRGEPAHLISQRTNLVCLGLTAPLIFFAVAYTGFLAVDSVGGLIVFVLPALAGIVGTPAIAASYWIHGLLTALTRDHATRSDLRRRESRIAIMFLAWLAGVLFAGCAAEFFGGGPAPTPIMDFVWVIGFLVGGLSWSFLMLYIARAAYQALTQLRRAHAAPAPGYPADHLTASRRRAPRASPS